MMSKCMMTVGIAFTLVCTGYGWESPQQFNAANNCTTIQIPYKLCSRCRLRPLNSAEKAKYKKDIYDFETPNCLGEIEKYIRMNPCDTKRAEFYVAYKNKNRYGYERIAQFLYTVCEQCCDMIPIGSKVNEWGKRKRTGKLYTSRRGNGVAHFYYDICKLYPKITRIVRPHWKAIKNLPELCPPAVAWMESDSSEGWTQNSNVQGLPNYFTYALKEMSNSLGCYVEHTWKECVVEEQSIGRV